MPTCSWRAIRQQIASAVHILVQGSRLSDGSRRVTSITEVTGMEGDVVTLQDIFVFEKRGLAPDGKVRRPLLRHRHPAEVLRKTAGRRASACRRTCSTKWSIPEACDACPLPGGGHYGHADLLPALATVWNEGRPPLATRTAGGARGLEKRPGPAPAAAHRSRRGGARPVDRTRCSTACGCARPRRTCSRPPP